MKFGPFTTLGFLFTIPLSAVAQENQIGEKNQYYQGPKPPALPDFRRAAGVSPA